MRSEGPDKGAFAVLTRRSFLAGAGCGAAVLAFGGTVKAFGYGGEDLLRPPGGQDETLFYGACVRCERCLSACPHAAIRFSSIEDGFFQARLPKMDFHEGYCDFCEAESGGPRCIEVCPTGALTSFDPETDKIGVAVIDTEQCIAWVRGGCDRCSDSCAWEALNIDASGRPSIDSEACNGCGACVFDCTVNVYRTFGGGSTRAVEVHAIGGGTT